ncbi:MAG: glycosyltransferase family 39 protein, partial [Pseudomonadota bacterium]
MLKIFQKPAVNLLVLTLLIGVLFGFGLGSRPYSAPSESRYVEIGREMAESGDFVTPRLNYVKYFEKPPLFYWIQALATKY